MSKLRARSVYELQEARCKRPPSSAEPLQDSPGSMNETGAIHHHWSTGLPTAAADISETVKNDTTSDFNVIIRRFSERRRTTFMSSLTAFPNKPVATASEIVKCDTNVLVNDYLKTC